DPAVARLHLQAREAVAHRIRARAAVALQVHPEQAELAELREDLGGELGLLEPSLDAGQHPFGDELADGVTDHALLVREELVETEEVERVGAHRRPLYTGHRAGGKLRSREAPEPAVRPGGRRAFVRQLPPRPRAARAADAP